MAEPYRVNHYHKTEEKPSKVTAERRSAVTFVSKEQRSEAKWTKRDKKREIKCKKSRKRKKGLTK